MSHKHFSHFSHTSSLVLVSQPGWKNEMNQMSSELKKDSLHDAKHTMGVSRHLSPGRGAIRKGKPEKCTYFCAASLLLDGHPLFYIMFSSSIPDPPVLLIQLCARSRGSSLLIPLPQTKMWSP